ncbi:hypothetical protein [Pseudomonas mucidolens]|uniref:Uncharacterized protein n=1 Tax=Pseudomonas mucidolens TaxID=46679 RepID=A0A1H2MR21_9PSED|nr:hypothetical protein [Pseudomonas mucidolens]SDU95659.1 hypothetical protein SAMN05216202_2218 [Pseudomonas mucidolens]SQH33388.1 Uncharacterised protein [Pseudomonas mucidolens]
MKRPGHSDLHSRDYPVREDMALQRKVWRFERLGWYVLVVLIGLTLAGLFSKGPLSTTHARSADGQLRVEYQRFARNGSSSALVIYMQGTARAPLEIEISGELLRGFDIEMLQPQPLKASTAGEGMRLWVLSDNHGRAVLHVSLRSDGVGSFDTRVSLEKGPVVPLSQFIYP